MPYIGSRGAIVAVLEKLGIDPKSRFDSYDQDPEYTACHAEEVEQYFALYSSSEHGTEERAVLCCFILEALNELVQDGRPHPLQENMLASLLASEPEHRAELAYWMDTSDPDEENWWPITRYMLAMRQALVP